MLVAKLLLAAGERRTEQGFGLLVVPPHDQERRKIVARARSGRMVRPEPGDVRGEHRTEEGFGFVVSTGDAKEATKPALDALQPAFVFLLAGQRLCHRRAVEFLRLGIGPPPRQDPSQVGPDDRDHLRVVFGSPYRQRLPVKGLCLGVATHVAEGYAGVVQGLRMLAAALAVLGDRRRDRLLAEAHCLRVVGGQACEQAGLVEMLEARVEPRRLGIALGGFGPAHIGFGQPASLERRGRGPFHPFGFERRHLGEDRVGERGIALGKRREGGVEAR